MSARVFFFAFLAAALLAACGEPFTTTGTGAPGGAATAATDSSASSSMSATPTASTTSSSGAGAGGAGGSVSSASSASSAGGADGGTCAHDPCAAGAPLDPACDPGVATVCIGAPVCCTTVWTMAACAYNYAYTDMQGHPTTTMAHCGLCAGDCAHALCDTGTTVDAECNLCAFLACQEQPACCLTMWDASCVALAAQECASAPNCCG